jgi:hypothetical protein
LRGERETMHRVHDYEQKFKEGISIEYLKNVLIKYIETQVCVCAGCPSPAHSMPSWFA